MSNQEIAHNIRLTVHPSLGEFGPLPDGKLGMDRRGFRAWNAGQYTRLEIPMNLSGFGCRWIDYDTHEEAESALARAKDCCRKTEAPEQALAALLDFYNGE